MASFISSPTLITVNSIGNILTLTGTSTTWTGTPFSISGVSGCTITAQNVTSNTAATITVTAGSQIGMLVISDGTNLFNLSVAPANSILINADNFKRSNTALGGVGNGTTDVLTAFEISSNQLRTTTITGALFTGRLYWPTQFADGTFRQHFGPGTNVINGAVMLLARSQGLTSTSQAIGFYVFPGQVLYGNGQIFTIAAGSTAAHTNLATFSSGTCPSEGWIELITSGATMTGNVYAADGTTLVSSITYTGLTGTYLNAGYAGITSYNFNNFYSEYDAWETIDIFANPPFTPLSTTTIFAVTGQATNFSGAPFTVSGVAGCSIFSQVVTDATHATVTIIAGGTSGNLILTDTISGTTFTILVTATPQITITPITYVGNGIVTISVTGINVAFSGTPFAITGTPSATITATTILNSNNAFITVSVGSYAGILTITHSLSGATTTFQVYHPIAGILNIGYIGDSITFGTNGNPVGIMGSNLTVLGYHVTQINKGVSGTTSTNWATSTNGVDLNGSVAAFVAAGCNWVQVMLGTNDAKAAINTSPSVYLSNLSIIVNACTAAGLKVILTQPIWTIPNSFSGLWGAGPNTVYQQYYAALSPIVNNVNIFYGDTLALDWFEVTPTHLQDGVHPTSVGNSELGQFWTYALLKAIAIVAATVAVIPPVSTIGSGSGALNRAGARDLIRHQLQKLTSKDEFAQWGTGINVAGQAASQYPWPPNTIIDEQLDLAIHYVNETCGIGHVQDISIDVASTTLNGAQSIDLRTLLPTGNITSVKRCYIATSNYTTRLWPKDRLELDRDSLNSFETFYPFALGQIGGWNNGNDWVNVVAGTPQWFWIEGYTLYILPGSSTAFTLHIMAGTGILKFIIDTDIIEQLPVGLHKAFWDIATSYVAGTQAKNKEMSEQEQKYMSKGQMGIKDIFRWKEERNEGMQMSIGVRTGRTPNNNARMMYDSVWRGGSF